MADLFCANLSALRETSVIGLDNLTEVYVGALRSKFIWVNNEGGADDNQTVIVPASNPPSGRWICPQAPLLPSQILPWSKIDKANSALADLADTSASSLQGGSIFKGLIPNNVPYFDAISPDLILTTDQHGRFQLSTIDQSLVTGLFPFGKINWSGFLPEMIGVESIIYFNPEHFNVDADNNVSLFTMTDNDPGVTLPGDGLYAGNNGSMNIDFGTGSSQAIEGTTPFFGDLQGEHAAAVVNALRNVPLTFFPNELAGMDGYVLTLDAKNLALPYFYLAPAPTGTGGGGGSDLPPIAGQTGALQTNGTTIFWAPITQGQIVANFAITGFGTSISQLEIGQTLTHPSFTASYNNTVTNAVLSDSLGRHATVASPYTSFSSAYNFTYTVPTTITFTISVNDVLDSNQHQASCNVSWLAKVFWGHCPTQSDNIVLIDSLQSSALAGSRGRSFTVTAGTVDYIYYAIPTSMSPGIQFSSGGFVGGVHLYATGVMLTNSYGVTLSYDIYESDNIGLGNTTIVVS